MTREVIGLRGIEVQVDRLTTRLRSTSRPFRVFEFAFGLGGAR